jgi:hypothetical protein
MSAVCAPVEHKDASGGRLALYLWNAGNLFTIVAGFIWCKSNQALFLLCLCIHLIF